MQKRSRSLNTGKNWMLDSRTEIYILVQHLRRYQLSVSSVQSDMIQQSAFKGDSHEIQRYCQVHASRSTLANVRIYNSVGKPAALAQGQGQSSHSPVYTGTSSPIFLLVLERDRQSNATMENVTPRRACLISEPTPGPRLAFGISRISQT